MYTHYFIVVFFVTARILSRTSSSFLEIITVVVSTQTSFLVIQETAPNDTLTFTIRSASHEREKSHH